MENNLDKYFKDKLHDRKFEMKEDFWLGAEMLLDAQDSRRKRRIMFWWFGGGLGVLMLLGIALWFLNKNEAEKPVQSSVNIPLENTASNDSNTVISQEKNGEHSSIKQDENLTVKEAEASIRSNETKSVKSQGSAQQSTSNKDNKQNSLTAQTPDNQTVAIKKTRSPLLASDRLNTGLNKVNKGENRAKNASLESKPVENKLTQQTNTKAEIPLQLGEKKQEFEQVLVPAQLPLLTSLVTGNFVGKPLEVTAETNTIVPANSPKFHLGFMASQLFQPNPNDGENRRLGNQIGLVLRYDLNDNFYMASGLQYQRRGGHFEATKLAEQRSYRFGLELDTILLRPKNLHYLTVPVLIGWEKNRHMLEFGLQLDFLTGVSGETGSYQKKGEPPVKVFVADKKGWMSKDGYRHFSPTLQLGYNYRIARLWSLGLSANYTIKGIIDSGFEVPIGSLLMKESDKFYLNLKATYYFN